MKKPPFVTVLIPTFNHGKTLIYTIQSVLDQTYQQFEIFVVGDGVPDITRDVMQMLQKKDKRIYFFDNKKGEHQGELHRRKALTQAKGDIIAYLADDDLWFPEHLQTIISVYPEYNFVNTVATDITTNGEYIVTNTSMLFKEHRDKMMQINYGFGTTFGSHSMELYKKIKNPWSIAPAGVNTDLSFWRTLLKHNHCKPYTILLPTAIRIASHLRKNTDMESRYVEIKNIYEQISNPQKLVQIKNKIMHSLLKETNERLIHQENIINAREKTITAIKSSKWWKLRTVIKQFLPFLQ